MKHKGNNFELETERNRDLMRVYKADISSCETILLDEVWKRMAQAPSSRFWVSEERASIVVSRIMKGDNLSYMRHQKREMFMEIYRRVVALQKRHPRMSISQCCMEVVNSPAPRFYMTPLSIKITIYKIKRQWYTKRKKTQHS